jgi:hypothetical protein
MTPGDDYLIITTPFTPTANLTCVVTTSVQPTVVSPAPVGAQIVYVRNAMRRGGSALSNDTFFGHYLSSNGVAGAQPDMSRTSLFSVTPGQSVEFGVFLGNVAGGWAASGNSVAVATSYDCH